MKIWLLVLLALMATGAAAEVREISPREICRDFESVVVVTCVPGDPEAGHVHYGKLPRFLAGEMDLHDRCSVSVRRDGSVLMRCSDEVFHGRLDNVHPCPESPRFVRWWKRDHYRGRALTRDRVREYLPEIAKRERERNE